MNIVHQSFSNFFFFVLSMYLFRWLLIFYIEVEKAWKTNHIFFFVALRLILNSVKLNIFTTVFRLNFTLNIFYFSIFACYVMFLIYAFQKHRFQQRKIPFLLLLLFWYAHDYIHFERASHLIWSKIYIMYHAYNSIFFFYICRERKRVGMVCVPLKICVFLRLSW